MPALLDPHAAATLLAQGGVVAYPTEAVWGLGCDPNDEPAVLRILAAKQRGVDKGLILVAAHIEQLRPYVDFAALPDTALAHVLASWPGPHTWIMPATPIAPRWVTGAHAGIAVRVSAHPVVRALCDAFGGAVVSTSANPAGAPPPTSMGELDARIVDAVDAIVAGEVSGLARPTQIRDARTGQTLRD